MALLVMWLIIGPKNGVQQQHAPLKLPQLPRGGGAGTELEKKESTSEHLCRVFIRGGCEFFSWENGLDSPPPLEEGQDQPGGDPTKNRVEFPFCCAEKYSALWQHSVYKECLIPHFDLFGR